MALFANPPEGAEHGLKLIVSKIRHHICFKDFWKIATFILGQKKFQVKTNSSIDFVFFQPSMKVAIFQNF